MTRPDRQAYKPATGIATGRRLEESPPCSSRLRGCLKKRKGQDDGIENALSSVLRSLEAKTALRRRLAEQAERGRVTVR